MAVVSLTRPSGTSACVDCPARQRGMLATFAGKAGECEGRLECIALDERAELPASLFTRYAFGIVRRGVLVRERFDPSGGRTAVDVAGRGAYVPLGLARGSTGYAASRVLLCVYREANLEGLAGEGALGDLMKLSSETLERVERIAEARGRPSAAARIDALYGTLKEYLGPHGLEDLLQRDVAALLGMRTETVCRVLRARASSPIA